MIVLLFKTDHGTFYLTDGTSFYPVKEIIKGIRLSFLKYHDGEIKDGFDLLSLPVQTIVHFIVETLSWCSNRELKLIGFDLYYSKDVTDQDVIVSSQIIEHVVDSFIKVKNNLPEHLKNTLKGDL